MKILYNHQIVSNLFVGGFSLIEMMVVIAIIAMMAVVAAPSIGTIMKSSQLAQAQEMVDGLLGQARQIALTKNETVQVRFYRYADANQSGETAGDPSTGKYRGIQIFEEPAPAATATVTDQTTPTYVQASKASTLPPLIIMDSGATLSTLLNQPNRAAKTATSTDPSLFGLGTAYDYTSFQFNPDGSTDLNSQSTSSQTTTWFLTLHYVNVGDGLQTPPANYNTMQVDAYNGHVSTYRP